MVRMVPLSRIAQYLPILPEAPVLYTFITVTEIMISMPMQIGIEPCGVHIGVGVIEGLIGHLTEDWAGYLGDQLA